MSGSGHPLDILVSLDRTLTVPLYAQLVSQLQDAIRRGAIRDGARLPASRVLAGELGVSRGVVSEAYGHLATQGFLVIPSSRARPQVVALTVDDDSEPEAAGQPAPRFDFTMLSPDIKLVPRVEWKRALEYAIKEAPDIALDYGDGRGQRDLREALAEYLGRARGAVTKPARIVICQGTLQAIDVACRSLAAHGARRLAIEDPCAWEVRAAAERAGLLLAPIPVDEDGIRVDVLENADADCVFVTPPHQFPTGSVLSPARRRALLGWVEERDRFVIEDDYGAEFRYDGQPIGALQGLLPDRVIYLGSASKTFAPGLRLGWMIAPEAVLERVVYVKWSLDGGSPGLEQIAFARLVRTAAFERHLRRARIAYGRRREALRRALDDVLPSLRVEGASAGLHFAVRLPVAVGEERLRAAKEAAGVHLDSVERFLLTPPPAANRLVLGFARLHPSRAAGAARALETVLDRAWR